MTLGLKGIRVIEAASGVGGPMIGRLLADFGADVIKIQNTLDERNSTSRRGHLNYLDINANCNKKGMTLDLSRDGGRQIMYRLLGGADVFLSNYRPRQLQKFRLEYETLSELNNKLICAVLTGYGMKGPERNTPGYGPVAGDAKSGYSYALLAPGAEPITISQTQSGLTASLALAYGIVTALLIRERTGVAQQVDASLFNTRVWSLTADIGRTLNTQQDRQPVPRKDTPALMNYYRTKEGRWLYIHVIWELRNWSRFCQAIGREDLENDVRFNSANAIEDNQRALFDILEGVFLSRTSDQWKPCLDGFEVIWSLLQTFSEVTRDPQARANDFFTSIEYPRDGTVEVVANPVRLNRTPATVRTPPPEFSEHTEEILLELGYTREDIGRFREERVII